MGQRAGLAGLAAAAVDRAGPGAAAVVADGSRGACRRPARPSLVADLGRDPVEVAAWIAVSGFRTLHVAGDRESTSPGIGARAERSLLEVFRRLGFEAKG
jgi:hypothetical protein